MKTTLSAVAIATLITTGAMAQTAVVTDYRVLEDDAFIVQPWNLTVDDIDDMDIYGADGEEIGEVDDVLTDASGNVIGLSVEAGGFLGIGEKEVIMTLDQVELVGGRLVTALTEEQIEALPEWDD